MKEKTAGKLFGLCSAIGTGTIILLFIIMSIGKQITEYDSQIMIIGLTISLTGFIIRISYSKFKYKDATQVGLVVAIILLLLLAAISAYRIHEVQECKKDAMEQLKAYIAQAGYEWEQENIAIDMYNNNYTKDEDIMSAFYALRSMHPFLTKQMPVLREKMGVLTSNVTFDNYADARDQYLLCMEMNIPYSENYTLYFDIFDDKYKEKFYWINVYSTPLPEPDEVGRWEFMFAIESDYDDRHDGFEVEWYSDELEYIGSQLDFISSIL